MKLPVAPLMFLSFAGALSMFGQPANDNFNNAWALLGISAATNGSSSQPANATKEAGEPNHATFVGGRSVWFTWTAPVDGPTRISTAGSGFNTLLAVYTGSAVNALTQVAANNDFPGQGNTSRVEFNAQQGTIYRIAVDGRNNNGTGPLSGTYTLNLQMVGTVTLTTPTNGSLALAHRPIVIAAQVGTPNPPVVRVDFYHGPNLVAAVSAEPYSTVLNDPPLGANSFVAVMTDNAGLSWTSSVANVIIVNPGVTISTPLDGAVFLNTNAINVSTLTLLAAGAITNVEFFADQQKFGESATTPFSAVWSGVTPGVHRLTAVGLDDSGQAHMSLPVLIAVAAKLVPSNSVWKYLDNGSDQGTNWIAASFDDSTWTNGPAQLGYGDGDEATVVSFGGNAANKFPTTYFRHSAVISNAAGYTNLVLRVQRDDGAIVHINGLEAVRLSMPAGPVTYLTFTGASVSDDGAGFITSNAPARLLIEGTNVIAVEIHQADAASSDISFNLELLGVPVIPRNQPPLVDILYPTNQQAFFGTTNLILEVDAVDLDGTVTNVEFLVDGVKVGEDAGAPFSSVWNDPSLGPHTLRAVATDDEGARTTSSPITVTVYDSLGSPLVQLTRPLDGAILQGPTNLTLAATVLSAAGITNVIFIANELIIGEDSEAPYGGIWTNAAVGTNFLLAVAFDMTGVRGTSAVVTVEVIPPPENTNAPVLFALNPPPGSAMSNLTSIQVTFSERVTGVDAADLFVNGFPAISVSGNGSNYTFAVVPPPIGAVNITWSNAHEIVDLGIPPLPFDAASPQASWTYEVVDLAAPTIFARIPLANTTVTNLTQVSVVFSELVTNVDAGDLLVNGAPAVTLNSSTNGSYVFSFVQPPSGLVSISWGGGHGITDVATTPNPFDAAAPGATWSFVLDARTVLVQSNATWRFIKGTAEASNPTNAWRQTNYIDSAWSNALAPFFYGDPYDTPGNPGTLLNDMQNNYTSIYLREHFTVGNLSAVTNLFLGAQSDDGFIAWINGFEAARFNLPAGDLPYSAVTLASIQEPNGRGAGWTFYVLPDVTNYLVEGENVLAVHAFNQSLTQSSDFGFNAQLFTYLADASVAAPRLSAIDPAPGSVFYLTNLTVTFSEPVTGVDAADFLVNGVPATGLVSSTNTIYTFNFPEPAFGPVKITWIASPGIADLDPVPKTFDGAAPGSVFDYMLLNPSVPTVWAPLPTAGSTVTNLQFITVTFSEGVSGLDAEDLLVNGVSAIGISSPTNTTYTFEFAPTPFGPVNVTWSSNHAIVDLEIPANEFDPTRPGSTWNYLLIDPVPLVLLFAPAAGATFVTPTNITLQAVAFDTDGFITNIAFFAGANKIAEDTNAPFAVTWRNVAPGTYALSAVATDNTGLSSTSAPVQITVNLGAVGLVLSGAVWKYLDNGTDQSNAWKETSFDDAPWLSGPSELGYGDTSDGRPEATVVSFGPDPNNKYVTTYFRHAFDITNTLDLTNLTVRLLRDDSASVYLNGVEVVRDNLPSGVISNSTMALTNVIGPDEARFFSWPVNPALLINGTNVLAVEIHQFAITSGSADISFDLELLANVPPQAPTIVLTSPANNAVFQESATVPLAATALDTDGTISRVEFFAGTNKLAETFAAPFGATWTNVAAGVYALFAVATDSQGLMATSGPVNITVNAGPIALVRAGSVWKYLDDGTDQNTAWRGLAFDDASWPTGPAQLGYGDGDEATVLGFGPDAQNKHIAYYFRRSFTVADPLVYISLTLDLIRDDGAIVYLNGVEVFRNNMPSGLVEYRTLALNGTAGENTWFRTILSPGALVSGLNVLAVEVHQDDPTSSDVSFDLQLVGATNSTPLVLTRGPYLQAGTPTSGIVRWRTDAPADGVVFYGTNSANLTGVAVQSSITNEHIVPLSGLLPLTKYFYSIGSSTRTLATGTDYWFVTAPVTGTQMPTRLWILGDSGTANQNARNVRDAYHTFAGATRPADIWLMLGDNAYNTGTDQEYQAAVFDMYPTTLRNLFLWPTIGNHDTAFSTSATDFPYLHIFSLPQAGEAGGVPSGTEKYFSFDYANIHFICLDSMTSTRSATSPMAVWLESDLAAISAPWTIVFFHHPPYTKGNHNSDAEGDLIEIRQNLLPIMEAAGVDLVLCGHSHAWERSYLLHGHYGNSGTLSGTNKINAGDGREDGTGSYQKNDRGEGVVYTVAGSSGQITGGSLNHPAHFLSLNELGSMVIDVVSNRLDAIFLSSVGTIRDHFTLIKPVFNEVLPNAPLNLLAVAFGTNAVRLSWIDTATNELDFVLERSLDGINFSTLQTFPVNTTNAVDTAVTALLTYHYRVRTLNAAGPSEFSNVASVTVVPGATPPRAPANLIAAAGNGFEVYRSTILLRWRDLSTNEAGFVIERASDLVDFASIATVGADVTHYVDSNLSSATAYYYRVLSLNAGGESASSNMAADETHPQSQVVSAGAIVTFQAGAEGVTPIRYQWRFMDASIVGATNQTLSLEDVQLWDEGFYSVVINDATGRIVTNPAWLLVVEPPLIVSHPQSQTNTLGSTAQFVVGVDGSEPITFQWRYNGTSIPGAVSAALTITNVQLANAGAYDVVVASDFDSITSHVAMLVINLPPLAGPDLVGRLRDESILIEIVDLLSNDTDLDNEPLRLIQVSHDTQQGGTAVTLGRYVLYVPPENYHGDDTFTYAIGDARGGIGVGVVTVVVTDNTPPLAASLPDLVASVMKPIWVTDLATDATTPAHQLKLSLRAGTPDGAHVIPGMGAFVWIPRRDQAPSTNVIAIRVTDDGAPPMSRTTSFNVVVRDYVEVTIGSKVVHAGEPGIIPIDFFSSAPLSQCSFVLVYPPGQLGNLSLEPLSPQLGTAAMAITNDAAFLTFVAIPGGMLQGTQLLARIHFTTDAAASSGFVPLEIQDVVCSEAPNGLMPSAMVNNGEVTIVGDAPMLRGLKAANGIFEAMVYGQPGTRCWLETTATPTDAKSWSPVRFIVLSGDQELLTNLGGDAPTLFYRLRKE